SFQERQRSHEIARDWRQSYKQFRARMRELDRQSVLPPMDRGAKYLLNGHLHLRDSIMSASSLNSAGTGDYAILTPNGAVEVFDRRSSLVCYYLTPKSRVRQLRFSHDGTFVLAKCVSEVVVWETKSGKVLRTIPIQGNPVVEFEGRDTTRLSISFE